MLLDLWRRLRALSLCKWPYLLPALLTLVVAGPLWLQFDQRIRLQISTFVDYRAFYCGALVAATRADPYRAEPLGTCERQTVPNKEIAASGFVVPAPIPGWVLFAFEPLARLPFVVAATLWWCVIVVSYYILQIQFARLFPSISQWTIWALLLFLGLEMPILLGQIATICVVILMASALLLRTGKIRSAAVVAALASIEPHIAIPVCMGLFCAERRARVPMLACAAGLAALSLVVLGPEQNIEYVWRVLPVHLASENHFPEQYSATFLATALGFEQHLAIAVGQLSYWLFIIVGCVLARLNRTGGGQAEAVIFMPMALSVLGGPFVHAHHFLAAVPLACMIVERERRVWWSIMLAVSVAWPFRAVLKLCGLIHLGGIKLPAKSLATHDLVAEIPWRIALEGSHATMIDTLAKFPTWIGLVVIATIAIRNIRSRSVPHDALCWRRPTPVNPSPRF